MLRFSNKFYFLEKIYYIIIFLYSILFFFFIYDYSIINFLSTDWLYSSGELASYQLSFEFYKDSEWTWPITGNPNYGIGINNNIILSDNITILNIIFKILAPILPEKFQFYGLWIFFCFFLQCLFSYKIIFHYTKDSFFSILASFFFLLVPVLLDRSFIHLSLMSHWIILCSFYLIVSSKNNKIEIKNTLLITLSLLVNLYISIIIITCFLFFLIFSSKLKILFKIKQFFFINLYILLILLSIGFFNIRLDNYSTYGFGHYKSNLLTFFDSTGGFSNNIWSLINIFDLPDNKGEEEGFAYLGAGGILLLTFTVYYWTNKKIIKNKSYYKILLLSLIFTLAAISNNVHIGDYNIININLNKFIMALTSLFRSSGRFIWPIHYLILISSVVFLFKFFKPKIAYCLIILIFLIQFIDISKASLNLNNKVIKTSSNNNFFESKFWSEISKDYENILSSFPDGSVENLHKYAHIISNFKFKKTNIIYQARADQKKIANARYDLYTDLLSKSLNEKSLYLIDTNHVKHINLLYRDDNKFDFFKEKDQWFLIKKKKIIPITNEIDADELFIYELSTNQNISFKELQKYLGLGWYKSHNGFWSDGLNSSILFKSKNKLSRFEIVCEIFNDNFELKNFEFYLNKSKITNITIKKHNDNHLIILDIKNYSLNDDNIFTIKNNNKISRSDLFLAPDGRILGLKIKSVNVL